MQGLNLQQTAANQSGTISVTPDIAFNSLQIVANGGMVCIIGFGLIVLFQLNRAVLTPNKSCPSAFSELSAVGCLAFSIRLVGMVACRFVAAFRAQCFKLQQPALSGLPQPVCPSSLSCASCACTIGIACIGLLPPTIPPLPSNQAAKRPSKQENLFQTALSLYISTLMAGFYTGLNLAIHLRAALPAADAQAAKFSAKTAAVKIFNMGFLLSTKIISDRNGNGKRKFQIRF